MQLILAALLGATVRTMVVPPASAAELRVRCPVGAVTRLVFPEALRQLRTGADARALLGLTVERAKPLAVLRVLPPTHPAQARVEFQGREHTLKLLIETSASGRDGELRLVLAAPQAEPRPAPVTPPPTLANASQPLPAPVESAAPAAAEAAPALEPLAPPSPTPVPAPSAAPTPAPPASPSVAFAMSDLMRAAPVPIGRREGLPGQLPLVLVDALRGESFVWLRFTLEGGAARRVRSASWQRGPIDAFTQEPVGKDLRIVVQLPREGVDKRARLQIELDSGGSYRVGLNASTLAGFLKSLFQ